MLSYYLAFETVLKLSFTAKAHVYKGYRVPTRQRQYCTAHI